MLLSEGCTYYFNCRNQERQTCGGKVQGAKERSGLASQVVWIL